MKNSILKGISLIALLLCIGAVYAQAPQILPYQGIARDLAGQMLANQTGNVKFTIHDLSSSGTVVFQEVVSATTNEYGMFACVIGNGSPLSAVNWAVGNKYLQIELENTWIGGAAGSYTSISTQRMMSVPYALYANASANPGPAGPTGAAGANGTNGNNGATGATGATGPNGQNGVDGANGAAGVVGPTGANGGTGSVGPTGPNGAAGITGPTGATGAAGASPTGPTGNAGPMGATGPSGTNGIAGLRGPTGATGPYQSLGLKYIIATSGVFPCRGCGTGPSSEVDLGSVVLFAGNFAPSGFAYCYGQVLPISSNTALFSLLGTYYGGNGTSTFALPNLNGIAVAGH